MIKKIFLKSKMTANLLILLIKQYQVIKINLIPKIHLKIQLKLILKTKPNCLKIILKILHKLK